MMRSLFQVCLIGLVMVSSFTGCSYASKSELQQLNQRVEQLEKSRRHLTSQVQQLSRQQKKTTQQLEVQEEARGQNSLTYTVGEKNLYSKVIEAYQSKNEKLLKRVTQIFLKAFPESSYADSAIYLNAELALKNKKWREVTNWSYEMQLKYPLSNKLGAVFLAEAKARQQLGEQVEALRLCEQVSKHFPGSIESSQAEKLASTMRIEQRR